MKLACHHQISIGLINVLHTIFKSLLSVGFDSKKKKKEKKKYNAQNIANAIAAKTKAYTYTNKKTRKIDIIARLLPRLFSQ